MNATIVGIENRFDLKSKVETLMAVLLLPNGVELKAPVDADTAAYIINNTMGPGSMASQPAPQSVPRRPAPPAAASFELEATVPQEFGGDYQPEADYQAPPRAQLQAPPPGWHPSQGAPPVRTVQKDEAGNPVVPGRQPRMQFSGDDEDGVPSV